MYPSLVLAIKNQSSPRKKVSLTIMNYLPSLASSWQCMKPSTDKYYQVKELTIYNVITIVIREYAAFSTKELSNIRLLNTNFEKMIPKGILLALHEAIHRQVLPSKGVDNIQCHHNSHQRICMRHSPQKSCQTSVCWIPTLRRWYQSSNDGFR